MACLRLLGLIALALAPSAQDHGRGLRSWTTLEGLPQNSILDIAQTPDGVLWMATHSGLAIFDGLRFRTDDLSLHPEFKSNHISQVESGPTGRLFIGSKEGTVLQMRTFGWSPVKLPCACGSRISALETDSEGALWIGAGCGLYRLAVGKSSAEAFTDEPIFSLAADKRGRVFAGFKDRLAQVWPGEFNQVSDFPARCLQVCPLGNLYALSSTSLLRLNENEWSEIPTKLKQISAMTMGSGGMLWVGGAGKLAAWDCARSTWISKPKDYAVPARAHISSLLVDQEGNTWVGTSAYGVLELYRSPLRGFVPTADQDLGFNSVSSTLDGTIRTVGTDMYALRGEQYDLSEVRNISHMEASMDGSLWVATPRGIERVHGSKRELVIPQSQLKGNQGPLLEARDGTLWTIRSGVLNHWDGARLESVDLIQFGAGRYSRSLFEDRDGRIWVGSLTSLTVWDGTSAKVMLSGKELPLGEIRSIFESAAGSIWVGTYGSGLCRIVGDEVKVVDTALGLFENTASALVADGRGNLLVMGNRAITRYSVEDLESVAAGEQEFLRGRVFNSGPGISIFEGNGVIHPRSAVDSEGHIWFPTIHGLARFAPSEVGEPAPPTVRVRRLQASNVDAKQRHSDSKTRAVRADDREILIQFSAASFIQPRQVTYRYRLVGRDTDWITTKESGAIRYGGLAPGDYTFSISAAIADGPFGTVNSSLGIHVAPTWLERIWVKRLIAVSLMASVMFFAFKRVQSARLRNSELELIVSQRTGELRAEIGERKRMENDLRIAGEDLEEQVEKRTDELAHALSELEHDLRERSRLEVRLVESEKLEIVGRLAGGLAHDFNNILTAVLGETDIALSTIQKHGEGNPLSPALQTHLRHVREAGLRASHLTRQLLAYSRQQVLQPEVVDPLSTLRSMRTMLTRLVADNIEIVIQVNPASRPILIDPGQLEQVIVNLVVNASEAMHEGGQIQLGCSIQKTKGLADSTLISVRDSGVGLAPEIRGHIFEPFYSTKGKARGLGLASVHGIVMQSGGSLEVEENATCGLTFHVGFPATDQRPKPLVVRSPASQVDGVVALLIDDQEEVRRIVRLMLEGGGVRVIEAHSCAEALRLAKEHADELDVLITDVIMPIMNGRELSQAVRRLVPGIKMLFISGHVREELDERDLLESHSHYLAKPFDAKQLIRRVAQLTRQETLV